MNRKFGLKNRVLARDILAGILTLLIILLFAYLIWGESVKRPNNQPALDNVESITEWTALNINGTDKQVTVPNSKELLGNKVVTITTTLGEVSDKYNSMLVWSKGQKVEVFFNDNLWYVYEPEQADSFGVDSTYLYLFLPLPDNASNSKVTITYSAILDRDGGKIGDVLIGDKVSCLLYVIKMNQLELFFGMFVMLLGIIALIISTVLHIVSKKEVDMYYLACAVLIMAFWIVANCTARQFIFPNASVIRDCAYLVLPLMPMSFSLYLDRIQKERYHIIYFAIELISLVNLIVISILNYTFVAGFSNTRSVSLIMIVLTIIVVMVTICYDLFKRKDRSYEVVAIGIGLLALCGVIQLVMEQILMLTVISGTFMSVGLIILVICGLLQSVRRIAKMDDDRAVAIEQVESLSRSAMEALAKTVDAKDRYTSGHSMRVARVACLIAKELGWDDEQIFELRFQGMMHDIGKIGVPDTVLNKPGKLSRIEFELIQAHTTVGSDILKNVTSIPGVEPAARNHHERYDGNGYPDHLAGEEIPLNARIIGIADAYDAMNSDRIYRKALPKSKIREELIKGKGTQFDPDIIDVFIKLLDEDRVDVFINDDSFVDRHSQDYDSTEFAAELKENIEQVLDNHDLEKVERVKLGEVTSVFRQLRDEYSDNFVVIVFSVRPREGYNVSEIYMAKALDSMEIAIQKSVREADINIRYSKTQVMAVLFEANPNSINFIVQRILLDFYKLFDASALDVSYKVLDIDEEYKMGIIVTGE